MTVTQKRLAELLGVDRTTVSKALSDHPGISPTLKRRVFQLCDELGYKTNYHAKSLNTRETKVICLARRLLFGSEIVASWVHHLHMAARSRGYRIRLEHVDDVWDTMAEGSADGIIIAHVPAEVPGMALHRGRNSLPIVYADCSPKDAPVNSVTVRNDASVSEVVAGLVDMGHSRIGFYGAIDSSSICTERHTGYVRQLNNAGYPAPESLTVRLPDWPNDADPILSNPDALTALLKQGVTAIVCSSDIAAVGVVRVLRGMGLSVPRDLSVTGFDDTLLSRVCEVAITSVNQNVSTAAEAAIDMLIELIEGREEAPNLVVPTQVVWRESTGPAPGSGGKAK